MDSIIVPEVLQHPQKFPTAFWYDSSDPIKGAMAITGPSAGSIYHPWDTQLQQNAVFPEVSAFVEGDSLFWIHDTQKGNTGILLPPLGVRQIEISKQGNAEHTKGFEEECMKTNFSDQNIGSSATTTFTSLMPKFFTLNPMRMSCQKRVTSSDEASPSSHSSSIFDISTDVSHYAILNRNTGVAIATSYF